MKHLHPFDEARYAAEHGLAVFPLPKRCKVPFKGSNGVHDATSDIAKIEAWSAHRPGCNWALATGIKSNVVVLEVDFRRGGRRTMEILQERYGKLPVTPEVESPSASPHLHFSHAAPLSSRMDPWGSGVEIKADGYYVLLPGSQTRKGSYKWTRHPSEVALAPLPKWIAESIQQPKQTAAEIAECHSLPSLLISAISAASSVDDVIRLTQPQIAGERNACILSLARGLRFNCDLADAKKSTLEEIVRRWHKLAVSTITTKPFADSWYDFQHAFENAKHPLGENILDLAASKVDINDLPECANQYPDYEMKVLVGICYELSKLTAGVFFFSSHEASKRIRVEPKTAWRMLRNLCEDAVIEIVRKGNERKANRYRWLGGANV